MFKYHAQMQHNSAYVAGVLVRTQGCSRDGNRSYCCQKPC